MLCAALLSSVSLSSVAHHSPAAFDEDSVVRVEGTVSRFDWRNPHVYIYVDATDAAGNAVEWAIEADWTTDLMRAGWTSDSLAPGDLIAVQAHPARNRQRNYANLISLETADGTVLASWDLGGVETGPMSYASSIAGRWLPDRTFNEFFALSAEHANDKGRAAIEAYVETDNPGISCVPHPIPQRLTTPHVNDIEILDDRVVIRAETESEPRIIYTDGRGHPADGSGESPRGHSIGRWEGDALIVETTQFMPHRRGNGSMVPSGPQKKLTERYALTNDGSVLNLEYVLEDPEFLEEPIVHTAVWRYSPHLERVEYSCDREVARRYLNAAP
jgi:hypothetical protein